MLLLAGCSASSDPSATSGAPGAPPPAKDDPHAQPPAPHGTDGQPVFAIVGATSDGAVVYTRETSSVTTLEWIDPATKATGVIAPRWAKEDRIVFSGKLVAAWHGDNLLVWSNGAAAKPITAASVPGVFAATDDGARYAYVANGRLVAHDTDVAPIDASACEPKLSFTGTRFFAASCDAAGAAATVRSVDDAGRVVTIATSAKNDFATDDAADLVFVISSAGVASIHSVADGTSTHIADNVVWGKISPDGLGVVFRTKSDVLKQSGTQAPIDVSTIEENVKGVVDVSPGFDQALTFSNPPDTTNTNVTRVDLQLTPIVPGKPFIPTPTKPTVLLRTSTGESIGFTAKGDRAIYVVDLPASGPAVGTLVTHTFPKFTDTGVETTLATNILSPTLVPGTSKVVFADHPTMDGARVAAVDVEIVDAETGKTISLAKGVDARFSVTSSSLVTTSGGRDIHVTPLE